MLQKALPEKYHRAIPEIMIYLQESFGNPTRIDYGTGHEMAFTWFLCCCYKIGALTIGDNAAVVLKIFNRYEEHSCFITVLFIKCKISVII